MSSDSRARDGAPDVDQLLRQVREEVERRRLETGFQAGGVPTPTNDHVAASWRALSDAITAAEPAVAVGDRLPPMNELHGLRRRLAVPVARVILRAAQLVTRDQSAFNYLVLGLIRMLTNSVHERLGAAFAGIGTVSERTSDALAQLRVLPELLDARSRAEADMRLLGQRVAGLEDTADALSRETAQLADVLARLDVIAASTERLEHAQRESGALLAELSRRDQHVRTELLLHERRIADLVQGLRGRPSDAALPTTAATAAQVSDTLYVEFEDRFRGAREDIKARVRIYLDIVREAGAGTAARPVLDVGCGRGEWLELLKESGVTARGVDLNEAMVTECRALGLDVTTGDVLDHLRSLPDASLGAVTGMHLLEHLEFPAVIEVLDQCTRVLQPGGVAIFETPNPQNLVVGASQFYVDPTHRRPLHPDAMAFLAETRGLRRVRILPLHPVENGRRLAGDDSPVAALLNDYFFGPQDFALIGYRADDA
jgi:O-antigen chain-terminating methyltransferase